MKPFDCDNLLHPFQYDAGANQTQRILESPLQESVKIDGRSLADLLHFFSQLSAQINFYNKHLEISDWRPFFRKSLPFKLAEMAKFNVDQVHQKLELYGALYQNHPSPAGLQLYIHYFYYSYIYKIDDWFLSIKGNALPIEAIMERTIKKKLSNPLKKFIRIVNFISKKYCVKKINTIRLAENDIWGITFNELFALYNDEDKIKGVEKKMSFLLEKIREITPIFENVIRQLSAEAENNIQSSLIPLKSELQKNHTPHLGLLFSFLNLFQYIQNDMNALTKKHLDFFYKNILQIVALPATADKAHIIFQIQKNLDKFLLKKGIEVKDGKDKNKAEIYFGLDDEIVVNQTKIEDVRTLFLNNNYRNNSPWLEGVYMAPDAKKADGVDIDFTNDPKHFSTLGAKNSKYRDPETKVINPYPNARLGFLLASPVLLLNEGKRTVDIILKCKLEDVCEEHQDVLENTDPCYEKQGQKGDNNTDKSKKTIKYSNALLLEYIEQKLQDKLNNKYYVITKEVLKDVSKLGISKDLMKKLQVKLTEEKKMVCYSPERVDMVQVTFTEDQFNQIVSEESDRKVLSKVLKPQKVLDVFFSGDMEWIMPTETTFKIEPDIANQKFTLHIEAKLELDKPAVTFYNAKNLKEELGTSLPSVKIVLNDALKIQQKELNDNNDSDSECCLDRIPINDDISFYQLFRDIRILEESEINVCVCGVKNLIVQNDENLQDVNSPILPFGPRPKVGSSFYIGSKEVFCKNWLEYLINVEWKDKPEDLTKWYENYTKVTDPSITEDQFKVDNFVLYNGQWIENKTNPKPMFYPNESGKIDCCTYVEDELKNNKNKDRYFYKRGDYTYDYEGKLLDSIPLLPLNVNSRSGFAKLSLTGIDFQHDKYPFVLARTLLALADIIDLYALPDVKQSVIDLNETIIPGIKNLINQKVVPMVVNIVARIDKIHLNLKGQTNPPPNGVRKLLNEMRIELNNAKDATNLTDVKDHVKEANKLWNKVNTLIGKDGINDSIIEESNKIKTEIGKVQSWLDTPGSHFQDLINKASNKIDFVADKINGNDDLKGIPKEPYTPTIKSISIDYKATAKMNDIDLIHLYPFKHTYKKEVMAMTPTLFPVFCDEGTLYLGFKDLVPGNNLNVLFQLAEATSDSESEKETVHWHYLDNNEWKLLRKEFEVLNDATDNLTNSGIIKFALPENMTIDNMIMPSKLHWIKASIPQNSRSVAEAIAIHPQAALATFTNEKGNDRSRLGQPLEVNKISKLKNEKAEITKVLQPYSSFGGGVPEDSGPYYVRVSERLRHKGRAIQKWDYERLLLAKYPEIFTAKCINHSFGLNAYKYFNDFPIAPGFIVVAVIPDMKKLKAGDSIEPKVPVGLLEKMASFILKKTSPFIRIKLMNPRYEKVNICLKVKLLPEKDENYYKEQIQLDLRQFMAPWTKGEHHKISFGKTVNRSDIVGFLETRDYLDFILDIKMGWEDEDPIEDHFEIFPHSPRSILIAGNIEICIKQNDCEEWQDDKPCGNREIKLIDYCNEG